MRGTFKRLVILWIYPDGSVVHWIQVQMHKVIIVDLRSGFWKFETNALVGVIGLRMYAVIFFFHGTVTDSFRADSNLFCCRCRMCHVWGKIAVYLFLEKWIVFLSLANYVKCVCVCASNRDKTARARIPSTRQGEGPTALILCGEKDATTRCIRKTPGRTT